MAKLIDIFLHRLGGGGLERMGVIIANGVQVRGYNVRLIVLSLERADYLQDVNPSISIVSLERPSTRLAYGSIAAYLREKQPVCCLSFCYPLGAALISLRLVHRFPTRIIGTSHDYLSSTHKTISWQHRLSLLHKKLVYPHADHMIANTKGIASRVISDFGFRQEQISVIYNALDPAIEEKARSLSNVLHPHKSQQAIYAVGRLTYVKGLDRLIEAFALCLRQRPHLHLNLVGQGPLQEALENQAKELGIIDQVTFHGFINNMEQVYPNAALLVMSSHHETFGNVLIEAMAFGTPVVAFDCDYGPREIIIPNVNGLLVEEGNIPALSEAILQALDTTWDSSQIIATTKRFSSDTIVDQYVRVIEQSGFLTRE